MFAFHGGERGSIVNTFLRSKPAKLSAPEFIRHALLPQFVAPDPKGGDTHFGNTRFGPGYGFFTKIG